MYCTWPQGSKKVGQAHETFSDISQAAAAKTAALLPGGKTRKLCPRDQMHHEWQEIQWQRDSEESKMLIINSLKKIQEICFSQGTSIRTEGEAAYCVVLT